MVPGAGLRRPRSRAILARSRSAAPATSGGGPAGRGLRPSRRAGDVRARDLGADRADDTGRAARCWSALAAVAHYRGDFAAAARDWERAAHSPIGPAAAGLLASAALAAGYGGDPTRARALLDRRATAGGDHPEQQQPCLHHLRARRASRCRRPGRGRSGPYVAAIEEARSVGANFAAGVAGVGLASAQARTGDLAASAEGFPNSSWSSGEARGTDRGSRGPLHVTRPRSSSHEDRPGRPRCSS